MRPNKISAETIATVVRAIAAGHSREAAAAAAGITPRTLRSWERLGEREELRLVALGLDPGEVLPDDPAVDAGARDYFRVSSGISQGEAHARGTLEAERQRAALEGAEKLSQEVSGGRETQRREVIRDGRLADKILERRAARERPVIDAEMRIEVLAEIAPLGSYLLGRYIEALHDDGLLDDPTFDEVKRGHQERFGRVFLEAYDANQRGEVDLTPSGAPALMSGRENPHHLIEGEPYDPATMKPITTPVIIEDDRVLDAETGEPWPTWAELA